VLEPEGLQVLDELIFSENPKDEKNQIFSLCKKLSNSYSQLYNKIKVQNPSNEYSIEAMRLQLVRIFTMGITGFDTPGSVNVLADTKSSFAGMQLFLNENFKNLEKEKLETVNKLFDGVQVYLNNNDTNFENLDRLELLTKYIDPLYKELGKLQINSSSEYLQQTMAWNPKSNSIFSNEFLNPYFYTILKENEDSEELRNLGKTLFNDPVISNDEKISCATCHQPGKAFTDAIPKSLSNVQGKTVLRNSPTLINAVYSDRYFYDLRAFTLEQQVEHVIFNTDEFNTAYNVILKKLNETEQYKKNFKKVFGKSTITRENFSKALASYVLSLKSFNSPFDKFVRGENTAISQEAKNGFNLFMGKANCATCHFAPVFNGLVPPFYNENETEILGVLDAPLSNKLDEDQGRFNNEISSENAWIYEKSFKTTSVRNVELTGPYFHNGAYKTLEEVVDFYNNGGGIGAKQVVQNQTLPEDLLNLTDKEKKELIAFMKSLTDVSVAKK
jgi:cytochrome c peroxidase